MQQALFGATDPFEDRKTLDVTFKGKLNLPIHRWYRLTPSFSPRLALDIANHFNLGPRDYVLDPFSGVGTVPLCMKYEGIPVCSIELNPYLYFVSTIKTRTYNDLPRIARCFDDFVDLARRETDGLRNIRRARPYLISNAEFIPPIHNPDRWWSPTNLAQLVAIRKLILGFNETDEHINLLRMGILGILVQVSNAKHNHVSLTFAAKPLATVNVVDHLREKLDEIAEDLEAVRHRPSAQVTVYAGNSRTVDRVLPVSPKVSAVITSPPYPNRFSYARETRPHLFFFDFIKDAKSVGEMEIEAIGCTWGKATSVLMNGVEPANKLVEELLAPFTARVNGDGRLMANYVVKYFNNIFEHAEGISKVCRQHAKLAYVIGNSKFFDHPLPSDEILAGIFGYFGFALDGISKMRRRQSKRGLYESVVFMSR